MSAPYAKCRACGIDLATPQDASAHGQATMQPVEEPGTGVVARGHGWTVLNPTREEVVRRIVDREVQVAIERFCEEIDTEIRRGRMTQDEADAAIRLVGDEFADAWTEWCEEADR